MIRIPLGTSLVFLALAGCDLKWEQDKSKDLDNDGFTVEDGDCWDAPTGPDGQSGTPLGGADIHPGAEDVPYDGLDADCDGTNDFDADKDGHPALGKGYAGEPVGDDCNDDPSVEITVLNGLAAVEAKDVFPGAPEVWYDGVDGDCADGEVYTTGAISAGDFDQDGDNSPCAQNSPADGDGFCDGDCDDTDAARHPDGSDEKVWYDGVDDNCDGNDGDQDGDGHALTGYTGRLPSGMLADDCKDLPSEDFTSYNGFSDLSSKDIYTGATERWYDGVDQDCGGEDDFDQDADGQHSLYFKDESGNFGTDCFDIAEDVTTRGFVNEAGLDPNEVYSGASDDWYDGTDQDCTGNDDYDKDYDGYQSNAYGGTDCDDVRDSVHPGLIEDCGTVYDDDCNGEVNEQNATGSKPYYPDTDGDGYGNGVVQYWCDGGEPSTDYTSSTNDDCNDTDILINPGAVEICDAADVDEDCSGKADDADPGATQQTYWYADTDKDLYGDPSVQKYLCNQPSGYIVDNTDCDDSRSDVSPSGTEVCDAVNADEDCDGTTDDNDSSVTGKYNWYADTDGDTYGDLNKLKQQCEQPSGYVKDVSTDCNDSNAAINPAATEICDASNVDENCNGTADDSDSTLSTATRSTWYRDYDNDTYGNASNSVSLCDQPSGYIVDATDCDDTNAAINPAATEICDSGSVDENCNGKADDADSALDTSTRSNWYKDADSDGYGTTATGGTNVKILCDQPSGYVTLNTDCDDAKAAINPAAKEICDSGSTDEDCDGKTDDGDSSVDTTTYNTWYADSDGDSFGAAATSKKQCDAPTGYVASSTDCDDTKSSVNPSATEVCDALNVDEDCDGLTDDNDSSVSSTGKTNYYVDADGDGYGDKTASAVSKCDQPAGYVTDNTDCGDSNASVRPGGQEVCDGSNVDEDCDGKADDLDTSVSTATQSTWYRDADSDNFGTSSTTKLACDQPSGYVTDNTDCDDGDSGRNPGKTEVCDAANKDEDCDGLADDNDTSVSSTGKTTYYADTDGDTYGNASSSISKCDKPSGYVTDKTDCDDTSASINPAGQEVCDAANKDEDCDNKADDLDSSVSAATKSSFYLDSDSDNYGTKTTGGANVKTQCDKPSGYVTNNTDCNDSNSSINPAAQEVCDASNTDEDCDGVADDNDTSVLASGKLAWYQDSDGDLYGNLSVPKSACDQPTGYVTNSTDCDDTDAARNPGLSEVCDASNKDEDCDGFADDADTNGTVTGKTTWYKDTDGDGYGATATTTSACDKPTGYVSLSGDCDETDTGRNPGLTEICDGVQKDEDCDGLGDDLDPQGATGQGTYYADADSDTYGNSTALKRCINPGAGYVTVSGDCNDNSNLAYPGATEYCDGLQQNCSTASWTTASENNLVTLINGTSGAHSNLGWATSGAVTSYTIAGGTLANPDTINICTSSTGEYKVKLKAVASSYTNLIGMNHSTLVSLNAGAGNVNNDSNAVLYILDNNVGIQIYMEYLKITGGTGYKTGGNFYGGGIFIAATNDAATELTMDHCEITGNTATYGAGIGINSGAASLVYGDVSLVDTKVYSNTATARGGGADILEGTLDCSATSAAYGFYSNSATNSGAKGGAIYIGAASGTSVVTSSGCFWGTGANDNSPADIDGTNFSAIKSYGTAGGDTFTCAYNGCTP